ncbi:MAG: peptidase M16 inactive domain family [Monoraphidium minutum]|nr:MAG: peptidase M16 inactive domain family [Monoraphidium minutum]
MILTPLLAGGAAPLPGRAAAEAALDAAPPADAVLRIARALEQRVTRLELPNGMVFLVVRRPEAPVVSVHTYCAAGAWVEADGQTGVAHLLEHLAFKGTPRIGSRDWRRESALLRSSDEVFYELRDARGAGREAEAARLAARLDALQEEAQALVVPNAFAQMLTSAGAVGLNAATSHDNTKYYASLPSNQLELWFALEAERFQAPTFRELYREKQVVAEERASRIDNSPVGSLFYDFAQRSLANAYARPVLGYREDLEAMGRGEVAAFFEKYYHPRNLTVAIAGAADPDEVAALAEKYFGGWAAHPGAAAAAPPLGAEPSARPAGGGAWRAAGGGGADGGAAGAAALDYATSSRAGPLALSGYYRPPLLAPAGGGAAGGAAHAAALEAACDVLSGGRAARLSVLALEGRLLAASVTPGYPGALHAGMALVSAIPRPGESPQRAASLVQGELDRLAGGGPSGAELARVKKGSRAELLGALQSNAGLAGALAAYEGAAGGWRGLLDELAAVEDLTAADVRDVAASTFDPANSITALVAAERGGGGGGGGGGGTA